MKGESKLNDTFALVLAYPETVVRVSDEWYSKFLPFVGIGRKGYVRAGHAAMVLISKHSGYIEYFDFGRYITPEPYGRVRSAETDKELAISLKAKVSDNKIVNLEEILVFFSTSPELTHGEGKMMASICSEVNYNKTKSFILGLQNEGFVRYAAFKSNATNCVRFVTEALINGVTSEPIRKGLKSTKWFTPSSLSNVLEADTENIIYEVTGQGDIGYFKGSKIRTNASLFFDRLKRESLNGCFSGLDDVKSDIRMQWLSGIGSGAWFQLIDIGDKSIYRFKRISPSGRVDVDGKYRVSETGFNISENYSFIHNSNCLYFHIKQKNKIYRFDYFEKTAS